MGVVAKLRVDNKLLEIATLGVFQIKKKKLMMQ